MSELKLNPKPSWKELPIASIIPEPATSRFYKTGDWRSFRPIKDKSKCIRCGLCWVFCPDGAVKFAEDGSFPIDLDYCKGCGVCAEECPSGAIKMVEEVEE